MPYAKAIVAMLTAALLAVQTAIPLSTGAHGWVTVALATLGAGAVYLVPNTPTPPPAPVLPPDPTDPPTIRRF